MNFTQYKQASNLTGWFKAYFPIIFSLLLIASMPGAFAQGIETDSGSSESQAGRSVIDEITVTARRREESLQNVPISVSAFTGADLAAMSLTSLKEVGHFTPNMTVNDHAQQGNTPSLVYIRGIGQEDPAIFWEPGVGTYVDGVYNGRLVGIDIDLMEVERVEVLRGPQGTLFGRNTIGGAINVVSVKPDPQQGFSGNAEVIAGRFDRLDGRVRLNVPLVPGKLAAKVGAATRNRDGYGERLDFETGETIGDMGNKDSSTGQIMLNWTPNEDVGALFTLDTSRVRESGAVRKLAATGQAFFIGLTNIIADPDYGDIFLTDSEFTSYSDGVAGANELDVLGGALTIDWDLGDLYFKSITSYRDMETRSAADDDGSIYKILHTEFALDQEQLSQEFQLGGVSANDRLDWLAGFFYYEEDAFTRAIPDGFEIAAMILGVDFLSFTAIEQVKTESYAVFGQGTYSFTDQLSMTAGLRYTEDEKEVFRQRNALSTGRALIPPGSQSNSWNDPSGRVGIEYSWDDDKMAYFSVARGYKSGGINARSTRSEEFVPFEPETVLTYEVGLRSEWLDNSFRFNATIYFNDYEDIQFLVQRNDPMTLENLTFVDNAAAAEIKGFELEFVAAPTEGLSLSAAIGYTDAEYTEVEPGSAVSEDSTFINTPEWSAVFSGQYAMPLENGSEFIGRLDYTFQSETYYDIENSPLLIQDDFGLLRARIDFVSSDGKWEASVFGTNLTDERYITAGIDRAAVLGFSMVQYGRPREWGVSFRYNF